MKDIFKKTTFAVLALTMAIPAAVTTTTPSQAGSRDALVGGIVGGVIGGAIVGSSRRYREPDVVYVEPRRRVYRERRVVRRGGHSAHVNWCYRKYRSYEARSNTYVSYGGRVKTCYSPY